MDYMKELMPVIVKAIETGSTVAIWYLVVLQGVGLLKFFAGWGFFFAICKGIYSLVDNTIKIGSK